MKNALSYWNQTPWNHFFDFGKEVENLFNLIPAKMQQENTVLHPAIDMEEDEKNLFITVDLPGVKKEDIKLNIENHHLYLEANRHIKRSEKKNGVCYCERRSGTLQRMIQIPNTVSTEQVDAKFENGVLKITLPKVESAKGKEVLIH